MSVRAAMDRSTPGSALPTLLVNQVLDRQAASPSDLFQIGLRGKTGDVPETQIGHDLDRTGNSQHLLERRVVQDTDPSQTDPFRSGGQPEVLDGAARAVEVRVEHRGAPQHVPPPAVPAAGDAHIDGRIFDPLQFEATIE